MGSSQQQLLRTILASAPGLLALKNSALHYEVVNPAFCQFLGKSPEEIVGKSDRDLFPESEAFASEEEEGAVLASGAPRQKDSPLTGKNGEALMRIARSAVLDGSGDPVGVFFYATDISEIQARAEAAVEERIRTTEAKAEAARQQIMDLEDRFHEEKRRASDAERRAQVAEAELSGARRALSVLRAAPSTMEEDISVRAEQLETQCRELSASLEKAKASAERTPVLESEVAALRKRLQEESDAAARQSGRVKGFEEETAALRDRLAQAEARAEEARKGVEGVELEAATAREKLAAAEKLAAEQAQRLATLEETCTVLKSEKDLMEEEAERCAELEARVEELQARLEEAERAAGEAKGGGAELQKLIEEAKVKDTTITAYEKTFQIMRNDMASREREISELRDALDEAKAIRDAGESSGVQSAASADEAAQRVTDLEEELKKKVEAMTAFGIEAGKREEELKEQLDQLQERIESIEDEATSLREKQFRAATLAKQLLEALGIA